MMRRMLFALIALAAPACNSVLDIPDRPMKTPSCGVPGKPCCGVVPATCEKGAVCSPEGCIAAAEACVRASDCSGVCTGPTLCSGNVCYACQDPQGSVPLGEPCTQSEECKDGLCGLSECTLVCAPGITADADCTRLGPRGVCLSTELTLPTGDGATKVTGVIGVCVRGCSHDADCKTGEFCNATGSDAVDRVDLFCSPPRPAATADYGEACTDSHQCKRGFCLGGTQKLCAPLCETNAHCTGPFKTCASNFFTRPFSGEGQPVSFCRP